MTRTEIEALIISGAGDGEILLTEEIQTGTDVKRYKLVVFETGSSNLNEVPTALIRKVEIYVSDEGGAGEAAYMMQREYLSSVDMAPSNATGLTLVDRIYRNADLRSRTQAAIIKFSDQTATDPADDLDVRKTQLGYALSRQLQPIDAFMFLVANNSTVQANGATATDSDLEFIVDNGWQVAAAIMGWTA